MEEFIDKNLLKEKLEKLDQLVLPNGAKGAVWLEEVLEIIDKQESIKSMT
jgi:hypothetical protein